MALTVIVIDDTPLTLAEFAHSCAVTQEWVVTRVQAGLLCNQVSDLSQARFTSAELTRARRLLNIERNFDANPELAALVVDMMEQIEQLKCRIHDMDQHFTDL